jgi:hypothetical protein
MSTRQKYRRRRIVVLFWVAGLAGPVSIASDAATANGLSKNSPFLPSPREERESTSLEFRGYMTMNGRVSFSIFNAASQRAEWIEAGLTDAAIIVTAYNLAEESISVRYAGRTHFLRLRQGRVVPLVEVAPPIEPRPGTDWDGEPLVLDREQYYEHVFLEIQRRRAERRAALQTASQSGATERPSAAP